MVTFLAVYLTFWFTVVFAGVGTGELPLKPAVKSIVFLLITVAVAFLAGMEYTLNDSEIGD